jgi:hypothetical protein
MKKNLKKFDLFSIMITGIILTTLAIGALVFTSFVYDMGEDLKSEANDMVDEGSVSSENAEISTNFISNDLRNFSDNYVFWFFVATFIGLLLTGMYLEFEPSVMIIIFIVGMIAVLGAWIGSEINTEFADDDSLSTTAGEMEKTSFLMDSPYFPIFIFIVLIAMIVVMYNKKRSGEYQ